LQQDSDQAESNPVSTHCFLCFGGRLRLSGITRVTDGAIPEFRAARRASVPLSKFFFRFFIPDLAGILADLEIERYLQIDAPIGGSVWESNPPFDPRRTESPALKAGKVTGLFSPPETV
jgi:hypothetical protein